MIAFVPFCDLHEVLQGTLTGGAPDVKRCGTKVALVEVEAGRRVLGHLVIERLLCDLSHYVRCVCGERSERGVHESDVDDVVEAVRKANVDVRA